MPAVLVDEAPECPAGADHVWHWFGEISPGLAINGMAPPTVTWEALRAWSAFMQVDLAPWEARAMVALGQLSASIASESSKNGHQGQDR